MPLINAIILHSMANKDGKCAICGSGPTVKAHLFPRALMLDLKGGSPQLVAGSRHRDGVKLHQNGEWDERLLCDKHEQLLGAGDDYGVDFCRTWRKRAKRRPDDRALEIANPDPDKLVHFAYGVIWRHVHCESGRAFGLELGPYGEHMLRDMESGGPFGLQLLVGRNPLTVDGKRIDIAVAPYRNQMYQWNVWHFAIAGLDFYLKADRRPFPDGWTPYLANGNDPIVIAQTPVRGMHEAPKLFPIIQRMYRTSWKG